MNRLLSLSLAVSLGVGPHLAHAASPYAGLQDPLKQQQMEYAKEQFAEGEKLLAAGDAAGAVKKYETAYQYAPELHLLNYNIGVAAMQAGECVKAKTAFQRFLDLVPEHEMRGDAQQQLLEIERSGCARAAAPPPGPVTDEDAPDLTSKRPGAETDEDEGEGGDDEGGKRDRPKKMNTLMLAGVGLMAGGGALLLSGGIAGIVALSNAKKLNQLGMAGPTGFSPNSYEDDATFRLDVGRKNAAITSAILMPLGGALLVTGVALFVVGQKKKKAEKAKAAGGEAGADETASRPRVRMTGVGPTWLRGGGGVSASFSFGL